MKNLFLVAAFMLIADLATAQILSVEPHTSSSLRIKKEDGSVKDISITNREFLGYSSGVIAMQVNSNTIQMFDANGIRVGSINYMQPGWYFHSAMGNEVRIKTPTSIRRYSSSGQYLGTL